MVGIFGAIALALVEVLIGAMLFAASPLMHFIWVVGSLFTVFFLDQRGRSLITSPRLFGFLVVVAIPISRISRPIPTRP